MARQYILLFYICSFLMTDTAISFGDAQSSTKKYSKEEIQALLQKVWQVSESDWNNLRDYVFSEKEVQIIADKGGCSNGKGLPENAKESSELLTRSRENLSAFS